MDRHVAAAKAAKEPEDGSSLPPWFYRLVAVAITTAVLFPYPPVKYALAVVFALVLLSLCRAHPERSIFVFILAMPALELLPKGLIPIPGVNAESVILLLLWYAAIVSARQQPQPPARNSMVAPAVFYTVLLAVSAILSYANNIPIFTRGNWVSPDFLGHFADWKNRISFVFLAPLAFRLIWTPRHLRTMVKLIAITTILIVAQSLWDVREIVLSGMKIETNRAVGMIAAQPNLFGGFLALVLAMYVPVFLQGSAIPKSERILYAVLLGAGGMDLLFTLSRGAWLALLLGLSVVALFRGAKLVVLLLVLGLTAPLWLPKSVVDRVELTKQGSHYDPDQTFDDSTQVRVDQWNALPKMMAEAPIFGHGFRSFPSVWYRFGPDHRPKAAHSSIIEIATEEGVFGVLAYAWLVSALFRGGWRARRLSNDPLARELALGLMAACVCLVMLDSSGTRFRSGAVMAYVWIVGGAIHRMASVPEDAPVSRVTPPLRRV